MKLNNNAFNIKLDRTRFENVSYEQWTHLVQYILNYDLELSNIEKLDRMILSKLQLEAYIESRGTIPPQYQKTVDELNNDLKEIKKIKQEMEIAEFDSSYKINNKEQLKDLEARVKLDLVQKGKVNIKDPAKLYFQNPYFISGNNQMFEQRLPLLKKELKNIKWVIKHDLKPKLKKSIRMLGLIEKDFRRILGIKDPNIDVTSIFYFVRPYIDQIVTSNDYYYQELLARAL